MEFLKYFKESVIAFTLLANSARVFAASKQFYIHHNVLEPPILRVLVGSIFIPDRETELDMRDEVKLYFVSQCCCLE